MYVTFQAFFRWIGEEFEFPSPMKGIPVPKFVSPPIEPFTKDEVVSLIKGCIEKRESKPSNRKAFTTRRSYTLRDQTVIKFLLDTGLRASEFSSLRLGDVDLVTGRVVIRTGKEGGAKGGHPGESTRASGRTCRQRDPAGAMSIPERPAGCRRSGNSGVPFRLLPVWFLRGTRIYCDNVAIIFKVPSYAPQRKNERNV
jgi:hypothetical protein